MVNSNYNPDVLNCIANLSNDEVFTPPELANRVLDLLPQDLFKSPDTKFLDPFSKSGVFLREIVKRLDRGLESQMPDRQLRIDHIMHNQVFGIAITELTSYLSRRSVYCSKHANGKYSVSRFNTESGNILYANRSHTWENGKCKYCGASQTVYDRGSEAEQYAYMFIHTDNPKQFFGNMKFDVIVGNPPYQLSCKTENNITNVSYAKSIYPEFIEQACKLSPRYLLMITPSRWMTKSGMVSEEWADKFIHCNHFREMHDYPSSSDCFTGVDIMGGVSYFLYEKEYTGKCDYYYHHLEKVYHRFDFLDAISAGIVVRDPRSFAVIEKIMHIDGKYYENKNFSELVCQRDYFTKPNQLTSNWTGFAKQKDEKHPIKYYLNKRIESQGFGWINKEDIPKHHETIPLHKVFIPKAHGSYDMVLGRPFYGEPNSVCSTTYLCIGYDPHKHNFSKSECENIITYICSRFFRFLVAQKKTTQDAPREVYQFVPIQDFSHPWTDEMLYKKYGLNEDEITFIESMIRPME